MNIRTTFLCGLWLVAISTLAHAQTSYTPEPETSNQTNWYDAAKWDVEGKGWKDTITHFSRLPERAKNVVSPTVWELSADSTGLVVRFKTDASTIRVRHKVTGGRELSKANDLTMPHMTTVASSGVDLYAKDVDGRWRWAASSKPHTKEYDQAILDRTTKALREYMLYLPLYNHTESLAIGVPKDSYFEALPPCNKKPIVHYGTSIPQGCSATRAGMTYPAIFGRRLDYPVINFSFSGSARMEAPMADLVGEIDAEIYVLDCIPNMTLELVNNNAEIFIRKLRQLRPDTPIVLIEDRSRCNTWLLPEWENTHRARRAALRGIYEKLVNEGMSRLVYIEGDKLFGDDDEGTVDGSHPSDLGMFRAANVIEPVLREILESIKP